MKVFVALLILCTHVTTTNAHVMEPFDDSLESKCIQPQRGSELRYAAQPIDGSRQGCRGAGTVPNPAATVLIRLQPPPMTDAEMMEGRMTSLGKTTHARFAWWLLKFSHIPMSLKALFLVVATTQHPPLT